MKPPIHPGDPLLVDDVRAASRRMVRELGFMRPTLAATAYPPSAVHALIEISTAPDPVTATRLADLLGLDKSSVSRMLRKLVDAGEIKAAVAPGDARAKPLALTRRGRRTVAAIHASAHDQVAGAMARLPPARHRLIAQGLADYANALEACRTGLPAVPPVPPEILQGYQSGLIGRIVDMHARFYARTVGFGAYFESLVSTGLADFVRRLPNRRNAIWTATQRGLIVGSVAVDGEDLGENVAHLRWFIVDEGLQGAGTGRRLLARALAFCDSQDFSATRLWTFRGLDAARRLYEDFGFTLEEEHAGRQWGNEVVEQRFVRRPGAGQA